MADRRGVVTVPRHEEEEEDRTPQREDYARALAWVLDQRGVSHRELAERLGWKNHTRIYNWLNLKSEPFPWQVFAIERAVGVPPGTLSLTLGYLPPEARSASGAAVSFDDALEGHPFLTPQAKRIIRTVVREFTPTEAKQPRRRR
jgi:hypothetical protein